MEEGSISLLELLHQITIDKVALTTDISSFYFWKVQARDQGVCKVGSF